MLTMRDHQTIEYIKRFKAVETHTIKDAMFPAVSMRRCRQRLARLAEGGWIRRERGIVGRDYLYFIDKPRHLLHTLAIAKVYADLQKEFNIIRFEPEFAIGPVVADAYFEYEHEGDIYGAFLEVQLSRGYDQKKYEMLFASGVWRKVWESFPLVVIVTDHTINPGESKIMSVVLDIRKPEYCKITQSM